MIQDDIATSMERLERAVSSRPGFGVTTSHATATVSDGVRCTVEDGPWRIDTDLATGIGGTATGPSPTVLLRAALASCIAAGYRLRAARHGVPLTAVRVVVETESAVAGMLRRGSGEPAGFRSVRYHVEVDSPAPHDDVMRVIDEGDALSPVLDVFATAYSVERSVAIVTTPCVSAAT